MNTMKKGFTLIELLIVIALLGALAVALLAALDPLEQIKKGTDTGVRNTVTEIGSSLTRYASVKAGSFPFSGTITFGTIGTTPGNPMYDAIQEVIDAGELKADFFTLAKDQLNQIYVTAVNNAGTQKAYVCFQPSAKSFRVDPNTKFGTVAGTQGVMTELTGCDASGMGTGTAGTQTCYWCVQ